jgi:uncharacterized protein YndB with AHSA1/START domain
MVWPDAGADMSPSYLVAAAGVQGENGGAMNLVATVTVTVHAPAAKVWEALTTPRAIETYMFGSKVSSEWKVGSPITWKGVWQGKPYEDKGVVVHVLPEKKLQYTHFSPLSGLPDKPENYHTVTVDLEEHGDRTRVSLAQDNNPTEEARQHSEKNWGIMLEGLKKYVES